MAAATPQQSPQSANTSAPLLESIERYRGRARALSALPGAATGALIAGLVFAPGSSSVDEHTSAIASLAVVGFAISLTFLSIATLVTKKKRDGESQAMADGRALQSVTRWTKSGACFALLGTLGIFGMTASVHFQRETARVAVIQFELEAFESLKTLCPNLTNPTHAAITDLGDGRARIQFSSGTCSAAKTELTVKQSQVAAVMTSD